MDANHSVFQRIPASAGRGSLCAPTRAWGTSGAIEGLRLRNKPGTSEHPPSWSLGTALGWRWSSERGGGVGGDPRLKGASPESER